MKKSDLGHTKKRTRETTGARVNPLGGKKINQPTFENVGNFGTPKPPRKLPLPFGTRKCIKILPEKKTQLNS